MKIVNRIIYLLFAISISAQTNQFDHSLFDEILKANVHGGLVDYQNLIGNSRLNEYLEIVSKFDPAKFKDQNEELAFWINVYNAYTLSVVAENYPIESIEDLHSGGKILAYVFSNTVWDKELVVINGKEFSLNDIEHEIIRKKFDEPKIHFALVCAAVSCPPLRNEAYRGHTLNAQLIEQANSFLNDKSKNQFDLINRKAIISKIFDWYEEDFGDGENDVLMCIAQYLPESLSMSILKNLNDWEIEFLDYDWSLNAIPSK